MSAQLTGRRRYRVHLLLLGDPLLVLQVEERVTRTYNIGVIDTETVECWRDACVEDLLTGEVAR